MKAVINLLLSAVVLAACTPTPRSESLSYADFPQTLQLEGRTVPLDTALFHYPFRIRVRGDKAVVMDLHGTDYFCHLFRYPDFRYLSSLGKRGEAPEEVLSAENMRWDGDFLWMLDSGNSEINGYGFTPSGDSLSRQEAVKLDEALLRALDFVQYDDSTFVIPDYSGDSRFCWVDRKGMLLRKTGTIPTANREALQNARPALAQAWRSFVDYNPRNRVLAAVTQLGEVLEIYNLRDSTHVVCTGPNGEPEFRVAQGYSIPTGIMGFSDVQVTDNAVYAVFHGISFKEIGQSMQKGIQLPDGGRYIYVFSLKGKPLRKYVLDRHVYGIQVDEQRGIITATDVNSDEPIVEFQVN